MADVWWMENGSDLCDELTKERDEARAERDALRTAAQEVRRAWDRLWEAQGPRGSWAELRASIDALCPAAPVPEDKKESAP